MRHLSLAVAALAALLCMTLPPLAPVRAADLAAPTAYATPDPLLLGWEIRAGALTHDPGSPERGSVDFNGEILFPKLWQGPGGFWSALIPHPSIGTTINFAGKTSNIYGGAAWNFDLWRGIFLSVDFGLGGNNGRVGENVPDGHNAVGCSWWFHESGSLGYHLTEHWDLMATIEHSSNANLCISNRGVTNFGGRIGYRF